MREQIARYIEQDVPYIDWSWYLWRAAYHAINETEIYAEHSAGRLQCDNQDHLAVGHGRSLSGSCDRDIGRFKDIATDHARPVEIK